MLQQLSHTSSSFDRKDTKTNIMNYIRIYKLVVIDIKTIKILTGMLLNKFHFSTLYETYTCVSLKFM